MGVVSQRKCLLVSLVSLSSSFVCLAVLVRLVLDSDSSWNISNITGVIVSGCFQLLLLVVGLVSVDLYFLQPADSLDFKTIVKMYPMYRMIKFYGRKMVFKFKDDAKYLVQQQEKYLLKLLDDNKDTLYGKHNKFTEIMSSEEFRRSHKITTYDTLKPYIDKLTDGEKTVLTKMDPMFFARTSGTTGNPKLIPINNYNSTLGLNRYYFIFFSDPMRRGAKVTLKKTVILGHKPKIDQTKGGLKTGPLSFFFRSKDPFNVSPDEVFDIAHENSAFYVHAIFACKEVEVGSMTLLFAHQAYSFFTFMEEHWQQICDDIENGTLTQTDLIIPEETSEAIKQYLKPDIDRARYLRKQFAEGPVKLAKRLWPDLEHCRVTNTGSMAAYGKLLKETFLKDIILLPNALGGSEGFFGISISDIPDDTCYHLAYPFGFFEFIREEDIDKDQPETFLPHEVKTGEVYELVITNGYGLYRYKIGDLVKIVGKTHQCPILEFQYRSGQILNILGEKTTEVVFYRALELASERLGVKVIDYTSCEDIHLQDIKDLDLYKRHYVLFIELDRKLSKDEAKEFDKSLCEVSEVYQDMQSGRQSISPMEVVQVKPKTFKLLKDYMILDTQNPQFKLPRALRLKQYLSFLMEHQID